MPTAPAPDLVLRLPRHVLQEAEAAAAAAWPVEACGLLVGRRVEERPRAAARGVRIVWDVVRWVPARNIMADSAPDRFEIDPQVIFETRRALRDAADGTEIVGHVHSHPNGTSVPSATDAAGSHDPDHVWLIVGVRDGRICGAQAWTPAPAPASFAPAPFAQVQLEIV